MTAIGPPLVVLLPVILGLLDHWQGMREDSWTLSCAMTGEVFPRMNLGTDSSMIGLWFPIGTIEIAGGITSSTRGEDMGGGHYPHLPHQQSLLVLGLPILGKGAVLLFGVHHHLKIIRVICT